MVDLSTHLSGPYSTMLLADMGADVIEIKRPGRGAPFHLWNRGKRSIAIDVKLPEDLALLRRMAARADALVENFRPEHAGAHGPAVGRAAAIQSAPDPCQHLGLRPAWFVVRGPWSGHGGFDLMPQGMAGLMAGNGPAEGDPHRLPIAISDLAAGSGSASRSSQR